MVCELAKLKKEIFAKTALYKYPRENIVSRTIHVVLSQSMIPLKSWYQKWFPVSDTNVTHLYPWVICTENHDKFAKELKNSIIQTLDVELYNSLSGDGYEILETINQVLVLCDLTEQDSIAKLQIVFDVYDEVYGNLTTKQTPFFLIGLFQLRAIKKSKDNFQIIYPEHFDEIIKKCSEKFDRIFAADISNSQGTLITDSSDLHSMLGQLILYLREKPIDFNKDDNIQGYPEWLKSCYAADGFLSGISTTNIVLPIDEIVETSVVKKGTEVLKEAFLGNYHKGRLKYFFNLLTNESGLFSIESLRNKLQNNNDYELLNPLLEKTELNFDDEKELLKIYSNINIAISKIAEENESLLTEHSRKITKDFSYFLDDKLQKIMSSEIGCVSLATEILNKVESHLKSMEVEISISNPEYKDPAGLIQKVRKKLEKAPPKTAIFFRSLLWGVLSFIGLIQFWRINVKTFFSFTGIFILSFVAPFIYWYAVKTGIERNIIRIENLLRLKWREIMDHHIKNSVKAIINDSIKIVAEKKSEIQFAEGRINEIITYFKTEYKISFPEEYSNWRYLLRKDENLDLSDKLNNINISEVANNYLKKEKPLKLWRRLSPISSVDLNAWEQEISEKAFIHLLPHTNTIVNLSICDFLDENSESLKKLTNFIIRASQPFIILKPTAGTGEEKIVIETPDKSCKTIADKFEITLLEDFKKVEKRSSLSSYRISFLGFLDNVAYQDIRIGSPEITE